MGQMQQTPLDTASEQHGSASSPSAKSDFRTLQKRHGEHFFKVPARNNLKANATSSNCPTCGAELQNQQARVDLNSNTFLFRGHSVPLRPKEAELLSALLHRAPGVVANDSLIAALWGRDEPGDPRRNLWVQACRIRKLLAPLGASVVSVHDVGYRFHVEGKH